MSKNSGWLVKTKDGRNGRTYHSKGRIKGKIPVYLKMDEDQIKFSDKAILCDLGSLLIVGYID